MKESAERDLTLERILSLIPTNENGRAIKGAVAEFSNRVGVAGNVVTDWKAGRNKSYMSYIPRIADAYNVSVDWLLGLSDIKTRTVDPIKLAEGIQGTKKALAIFDESNTDMLELLRLVEDLEPEKLHKVVVMVRNMVEVL